MLTRKEKKNLRGKASKLKKDENSFRDHYKRPESVESRLNEEDTQQGYGYLQLGFEFVISIFVFLFGGYHLDQALSSNPLFIFLGLIIGFSIGLYRLVDATKQ